MLLLFSLAASFSPPTASPQNSSKEEVLVLPGEMGHPGGRLVVALRAEPKTLNPVISGDAPSREVIGTMPADLVHIDRATQLTEPAPAKSWKISPDGLRYTLVLRRGLKFSDGYPLDADDMSFTFRVYLDEKVHAPERDLLVFDGKPISLRKSDAQTIVFQLPKPDGVAERMFDGLAILPRHLLERPYEEGKIAQLGALGAPPNQWVGLGPFRRKEYVAGQRLVLERNPYYWKTDEQGNQRPYLNELVFLFVPSADAQVLRFQCGETDVISRLAAGKPVEFSIITSSGNADRAKMAALIQEDLKQLGMRVLVVPLEFRSLLDRVTQTKEYDACILAMASYDADPNFEINVWLSSGGTHFWNPSQAHPATSREAEIDCLINDQMYVSTFEQREKLYDRAQELLWEYQHMIFLASPDILTGAKKSIGNFHPERLYVQNNPVNATR